MTPSPDPAPAEAARPGRRSPPPPAWESGDDERLLDVRMCDLGLRIRASALAMRSGGTVPTYSDRFKAPASSR